MLITNKRQFILPLCLFTGSFCLGLYIYDKYDAIRREFRYKEAQQKFEKLLTDAIRRQVFDNIEIDIKLTQIIEEFTQQEVTLILTSKLLEDLLRSQPIYRNSEELMREKVMKEIILNDEDIDRKTIKLIGVLLRD